MIPLLIFNFIIIALITVALVVIKRRVKTEKTITVLLFLAPLFTILCHYSSLIYHHFLDGSAMTYLKHNPNLILPIYPCNVVMWCCFIFGCLKNKASRLGKFFVDYIFWFGIISTLVGMFANVDFIRNPTLADFDVTKGILSHATLLFNVLLLPVVGLVKIDLNKNILHIFISVLLMLVIGLYCNLTFEVIASKELAYNVNSMFLLHSPFDGLEFLTYPTISAIAIVAYFITFNICEIFAYKKGDRWFNRLANYLAQKKANS